MYLNNKPLVSKRYYAIAVMAGILVAISGLALLEFEVRRMGGQHLIAASRTMR